MEAQHAAYSNALEQSLRVGWRLEDVLPDDAQLDLRQRLLPDALAGTDGLDFLSPTERLALNHIRGNSYLRIFGLVEEFILPFVVDHARTRLAEHDVVARSLLQFASEEAKHIHLFRRFAARFDEAFRSECRMIGPAASIVTAVLSHHPIGIGLITLHIEWMTQRHYVESVRDGDIDPLMKRLLKCHFVEEAQHARLDGLIVEELVARAAPDAIRRGVADYHRILAFLDAGFVQQVEFDLEALEARCGGSFSEDDRQQLRSTQQDSYRRTFIESGATHPRFLDIYRRLAGV